MKRPLFIGVAVASMAFSGCTSGPKTQKEALETFQSQSFPSPFLTLDGKKVSTKKEWQQKRRPELKELFSKYVYGEMPETPEVLFNVKKIDTSFLGGKATYKLIEVSFPRLGPQRGKSPKMNLALFLPNQKKSPKPVFLALNKCGNHTVINQSGLEVESLAWQHKACATQAFTPRVRERFWALEYVLERGYAFATFHESEIDPDKNDFSDGAHAWYEEKGFAKTPTRWATLAAWAWGLHRAVDYLVTDRDIDKKKISLIGHSRRGKAALWATALDDRVALVVPHQSGTGGMALSRENDQETTAAINKGFPHWFSDSFKWFDNKETHLPVDQHLLVSLIAPRPLIDTEGLQDTWANYVSGLKNLKMSDEVYRFLGTEGIKDDGVLVGKKITNKNSGNLLQYRIDTAHTLNKEYWRAILDFADLKL